MGRRWMKKKMLPVPSKTNGFTPSVRFYLILRKVKIYLQRQIKIEAVVHKNAPTDPKNVAICFMSRFPIPAGEKKGLQFQTAKRHF
jgi:hypothetical protein